MKITVLGSGTCASDLTGIPDRFPPGFWVEWSDGRMLFDMGEGIRFRLAQIGVKYPEVEYIAVTHAHADHYTLPHFLQSVFCHGIFGGIKAKEIHLFVPNQIAETWPALFKIYVPEAPAPDTHAYEDSYLWPELDFHKMSGGQTARIGSAILRSESVYHGLGRCDAISFRLEADGKVFAYSGDTGDCEGIRKIARGADLFVSEASAPIGGFESSKRYGHLTPFEAGAIAKDGGVGKLVLTHYPGMNTDKEMAEDVKQSGFSGEVKVAKDFDVFEL